MSELTTKNLEMLEYYINEALWSLEQDLDELKERWQNAEGDEEEELECQMEELQEKIDALSRVQEIF